MTNLEYISSSPEIFIEFIKSIKDDQSNPNSLNYLKFINWLSHWIKAPKKDKVLTGQIWAFPRREGHFPSISDKSKQSFYNSFGGLDIIEIKAVVEENNSHSIKLIYQSLSPDSKLAIISQQVLLEDGYILGDIQNLEDLHLVKDLSSLFESDQFLYFSLEKAGFATLEEICSLSYKKLATFITFPKTRLMVKILQELSKEEKYKWILESSLIQSVPTRESQIKKFEMSQSQKINEMEFSIRTINSLMRVGITTLKELCSKNIDDLSHLKYFGKKSYREVINEIERLSQMEEYEWIWESNLFKSYQESLSSFSLEL